jgi:acyl-CoA thioester hydrolase
MREEKRGVAAVNQNTTYRQELRAGDLITVRTCVLEMRERTIRFYHEMTNDEIEKIAATTVITGVHMDAQTRKPCPFPDEIIQRGLELTVDYNPVL